MKNEQKKEYVVPQMEVLELNHESALLENSCLYKDENGLCAHFVD